jgi:glycerophosphoryl diester phosphodiesterase
LSLFAPLDGLIASLVVSAPPESRVAFLKNQPYAHRGLHRGAVIENSRAAYRAAIAAGHGIETDVQAARDGEAMVFHDATLDRLTDAQGEIAAHTPDELAKIQLRGTTETIPQLPEMLAIVASKVPLLIEIKAKGTRVAPLCLSVRRALEGYTGPVAIMSFNPLVGAWFREHAPRLVRGLVVSEENKRNLKGAFERWSAMATAKPDFLACDVRDLPSKFAGKVRARGIPVLTWTVRDADAERRAFAHADEAIYEKPA